MSTTWMDASTSTGNDNWTTPGWLFDQLSAEFGPFTLDPASSHENALCVNHITQDDTLDGLSQPWYGKVFLNSPYGRTINDWVDKAVNEVTGGRAQLVVALWPVRADTRWYRTATAAASLVRVYPARLKFGSGSPRQALATIPACATVDLPGSIRSAFTHPLSFKLAEH